MMTWEVQQVFYTPDANMLLFVFWSTLCSYNFHSIINSIYPPATFRHEWNIRYKKVMITLMFIAALGVCAYAWQLRHGLIPIFFAAFATFMYSAPNIPVKPFIWLRKIAIGKTIFLAGVWTYATGLLPMLISGKPLSAQHYYFLGQRMFLVYAICILFDIKDRPEDRQKGIRALPTVMTEHGIRRVYFASLSLSLISLIMLSVSGMTGPGIFFLLIPIMICMLIYKYAITHHSDLLYFFVLDGLMMFSAILLMIYLISITFVS